MLLENFEDALILLADGLEVVDHPLGREGIGHSVEHAIALLDAPILYRGDELVHAGIAEVKRQ